MRSPHLSNHAPFQPPSDVVYFHDWRYVSGGVPVWQSDDGRTFPLFTNDAVPPLRYAPAHLPVGVELVAQPARKAGPVLDAPADSVVLMGGSLIHDDGVYRLWYECTPAEHIGAGAGSKNHLHYAESDDCVTWRLPSIGREAWRGSTLNNIVVGPSVSSAYALHGCCVFKDPSAEAAARYKAVFLGRPDDETLNRARRERPTELDPALVRESKVVPFGATSPDGLRWTMIREPLAYHFSDTQNVCEYDPLLGAYVFYCRNWMFGRRTIGRMQSASFGRFPLPDNVLWPGPGEAPHDLWYASAKTTMPGAPDYHLMFPLRWDLVDDHFEFHLATSPDNVTWSLVPGGPVGSPGEPGSFDAGVVWPGVGLVDLPGDRIGLLYQGAAVGHKHPRRPPYGKLALAWWPKGRLVALRAREHGSFSLTVLKVRGRTARLNFVTSPGGSVRAEVGGVDGRAFADCDVLSGDHLDRPVTWKGNPDLRRPDGEVLLKFELHKAELFGVRFE